MAATRQTGQQTYAPDIILEKAEADELMHSPHFSFSQETGKGQSTGGKLYPWYFEPHQHLSHTSTSGEDNPIFSH